jgi:hypothetical protein
METSARKLEPSICDLCGEAPAEFMRFRYWRTGGMDWPNVCRACDRDDPGGAWKLADWSWGQLVPHGARAEIEQWARERRAGQHPDGDPSGLTRASGSDVDGPEPAADPPTGRQSEVTPLRPADGMSADRASRVGVREVGYVALVLGLGALAVAFADDLRWLVLAPASTVVRLLGFLATLLVAWFVSGLLMLPFRRTLGRGPLTGGTAVLTLAVWLAFLTWVMYG